MQHAGISIEAVAKNFGHTAVLHAIDLSVRPGELMCLLGPSGCGKTTLLRCVAGLEQPDRGRITIGDRPVVDVAARLFVAPEKRRLGMVFQHYALWPHMTVAQNIAYPLRKQGVPRAEREQRIRAIMRVVGLPPLFDRRPAQLSGGQQQRVALARALVYEPPVLLLDEPLSNLDATLRGQLRRELRQLHERLGTTTVLVTHDQEEAAALADTIAVMDHGRVIQVGPAKQVLDRPATRFVAEFVGFDTFLEGNVAAVNGTLHRIALGAEAVLELPLNGWRPQAGTRVLVAARSDTLRLHAPNAALPAGSAFAGTVRHAARVGRGIEWSITAATLSLVVREPGSDADCGFETGAQVQVELPRHRVVVLPAENTSNGEMA